MQTRLPLTWKPIDSLVSGEIFLTTASGRSSLLLMKLFSVSEQRAVYGVLRGDGFETPLAFWPADLDGRCLSYGTDWILEPIVGPETFPSRSWSREDDHRLFLDGDGSMVWRFKSSNIGFPQTLDFVVGETQQRQLGDTAAPFRKFKVWASEEDRDRDGIPIFQFPPAPPDEGG